MEGTGLNVAALHTSKRVRNVIPYQMDGQLRSTNDILVDDMSFNFVGDLCLQFLQMYLC